MNVSFFRGQILVVDPVPSLKYCKSDHNKKFTKSGLQTDWETSPLQMEILSQTLGVIDIRFRILMMQKTLDSIFIPMQCGGLSISSMPSN